MTMIAKFLRNKITDAVLRGIPYTAPATLYVALYTSVPANPDDAEWVEVTGGNYARVAISSSTANWSGTQGEGTTTASTGSGPSSNNIPITFPAPTDVWGLITHWRLMDSATGGNPMIMGTLKNARTVLNGSPTPKFAAGDLLIRFDTLPL